jgi:putative flavoprotein involved in K+ transport
MTAPVLIIGAGPAGLATAASLSALGVRFDLVDRRGVTGGAYRHIRPDLQLTSPTRYTALPGLGEVAAGEYVTAGEYREYLERYARHHALAARRAEVTAVTRAAAAFEVAMDGVTHAYDAVVVAAGMYDFPRWPDVPGLRAHPRVVHARDFADPGAFRGREVAILGGATSAVEVAEALAHAGARPVLCARRLSVAPQRILGRDVHDLTAWMEALPRWLLGSYCDRRPTLPATDLGFGALVRDGRVRVAGAAERFDGSRMVVQGGEVLAPEAVVVATGYDFSTPFLPPDVPRARAGHPRADGGEVRGWPGLYVVGYPCARSLASEFLRGVQRDSIEVAGRIARRVGKESA